MILMYNPLTAPCVGKYPPRGCCQVTEVLHICWVEYDPIPDREKRSQMGTAGSLGDQLTVESPHSAQAVGPDCGVVISTF